MKLISPSSMRIVWALLGVILLAWLTLEDRNPRTVLFLSLVVCSLAVLSLSLHWHLDKRPRPYAVIPLVTAAGLAVVPVGLLLMVLKTGLHAHLAPDFTPDQIAWIVSRFPVWGLVGLLAGCSAFLWLPSRREDQQQYPN